MNVVPAPSLDSMAIVPRSASMPRRTTSIPTPRPERSVTSFVVVKPGSKMTLSSAPMAARSSPAPSSETRMMIVPASCLAARVMWPTGDFPLATRSLDGSMP